MTPKIPFLFFLILLLFPANVYAQNIFFHEDFENEFNNWDGVYDASISEGGVSGNYSVRLSFKEYRAQYLMREVRAEEQPDWSFVYEFHVKLHRFSGKAVTLAALVFPTGKIAVVASRDGLIGLAFDLFEEPRFSNHKLRMEEWEKIQLYVDYDNEKVELYLNDVKVLEDDLMGRKLPLLKIWIGVIWTGGGGEYGMIMEGYFDHVTLGGKDLLTPKPAIPIFAIAVSVCVAVASIIALALIIKRKRVLMT